MSPTATSRRPHGDDGALVLAAAIAMPLAIVLFGLVVDGGYTLAQRQRATHAAEDAARAGANALAVPELRRGAVRLDPAAATAAARGYLSRAGYHGTVTIADDTITVHVTATQKLTLLPLIGLRQLTVHGDATARAVPGITGPNQ